MIEFDKPFTYTAAVDNGNLREGVCEQQSAHAGAVIGFSTRKGEKVHARIASSFIGYEQAERNLLELGSDGFDALVQKGAEAWNDVLGRIEVEGGSWEQQRTFYSCLYRSLLSRGRFMSSMPMGIRCTTVLTADRSCPATCTPIRAFGIHSAVCSLS